MHIPRTTLVTTTLLAAALLAGCAGNDTIVQRGSSTVLPLAEHWAEDWGAREGVAISVSGGGSGAGASGLCAGEVDLADMSREMKEAEKQQCRQNGIEPVEWKIAYDAVTVAVNKDNDFVEDLTVEQLEHIFRSDDPATTWDQVDPDYPAVPVRLCYPGSDSGTYEYFNEAILDGDTPRSGQGVQQSEDDNVLVACLDADENAIGYFGLAYFLENQDKVDAVRVDGVAPTRENVEEGSYQPLGRFIYIYTDGVPAPATPLNSYFQYVYNEGQAIVPEVGYVPLDAGTRQAMLDQLG